MEDMVTGMEEIFFQYIGFKAVITQYGTYFKNSRKYPEYDYKDKELILNIFYSFAVYHYKNADTEYDESTYLKLNMNRH